ncbi:hypothetical protein COE74_09590 [Bacillus toyonensis]|nr:hypothetical protein COE74_09590 [Bacillus toyonensis]
MYKMVIFGNPKIEIKIERMSTMGKPIYGPSIDNTTRISGVTTIKGRTETITNLAKDGDGFVQLKTLINDGTEQIINFTLEPTSTQVYVQKVDAKSQIEWAVHVHNASGAAVNTIEITPIILKIML